jgi:hypothetical protein
MDGPTLRDLPCAHKMLAYEVRNQRPHISVFGRPTSAADETQRTCPRSCWEPEVDDVVIIRDASRSASCEANCKESFQTPCCALHQLTGVFQSSDLVVGSKSPLKGRKMALCGSQFDTDMAFQLWACHAVLLPTWQPRAARHRLPRLQRIPATSITWLMRELFSTTSGEGQLRGAAAPTSSTHHRTRHNLITKRRSPRQRRVRSDRSQPQF